MSARLTLPSQDRRNSMNSSRCSTPHRSPGASTRSIRLRFPVGLENILTSKRYPYSYLSHRPAIVNPFLERAIFAGRMQQLLQASDDKVFTLTTMHLLIEHMPIREYRVR